MVFKIGLPEVKKRQKNNLYGVVLSIVFLVVVTMDDKLGVQYNDILLLSIVFFFVFANVINLTRHAQWKKLIETHQVEVLENVVVFMKDGEKTTLTPDKINILKIKRRDDKVVRITIKLVIGNKIRLEGYNDMDDFAKLLAKLVKPEKVEG